MSPLETSKKSYLIARRLYASGHVIADKIRNTDKDLEVFRNQNSKYRPGCSVWLEGIGWTQHGIGVTKELEEAREREWADGPPPLPS